MKIDRNVPLPTPTAAAKVRVPVESLEVGDSIFFAGVKRMTALGTVKATAMRANLRHNYRSAIEGDGTRVWRTA